MVNPNLEMLSVAVKNLDYLTDELVFVGGCTTGLLITDEGAAQVRETKDVDTIVEAASYSQYVEFSERLQQIDFSVDTSPDAPLCRWVKGETILDVMPLDEKTLGFSNSWYKSAMENARQYEIFPGKIIRVVSPPYFCATKLEAFDGRGKGDFLASHDLEDLICVVDGRIELIDEINQSADDAREFISTKIKNLLDNRQFCDALPGYLHPDEASQNRLPILIERLRKIALPLIK